MGEVDRAVGMRAVQKTRVGVPRSLVCPRGWTGGEDLLPLSASYNN